MLKKNLGFIIFLAVTLVAAGVVFMISNRHARHAQESRRQFEDHTAFFDSLARQRFGINETNLQIARENLQIAQAELASLRDSLESRSQLQVPEMTAVQAKNHLGLRVRRMTELLQGSNIAINEQARGFSFQQVLQAPGLPEATREVPALTSQMRLAERLLELVAESKIDELIAFARPAGIRQVRRDDYVVTRFNLQVRGSLGAVKNLIKAIHGDQDYYFVVPYFQWEAGGVETGTVERGSTPTRMPGREPMDWDDPFLGAPDMAAFPRRTRRATVSPGQPREPARSQLTREQRQVLARDSMTAMIPIHFIEFKPEQEN